MRLYGTTTSPYVRRIRILAAELGVATERFDTATDAGQAALRDVTPLAKVPTAVLDDGRVLWDSEAIKDALVARHGWGGLTPPADPELDRQTTLVINGALDAAVNVFYLRRDGVDPDAVPYLRKQQARVDAAMRWVTDRLLDGALPGAPGWNDVILLTTLDWMRFRGTWPVEAHPPLVAVLDRWNAWRGWGETRPA